MSEQWTEAELCRMVRLMPEATSLVRSGRLIAVSDELLRVSGAPREALEGRNYDELLPPAERARVRAIDDARRSNPDMEMGTLRFTGMGADGQKRSFEVRQRLLKDPRGGAPYVLVVHRVLEDTSNELQLATDLVKLAAELLTASSEDEAYALAVAGFQALGVQASFFRFSPAEGTVAPLLADAGVAAPLRGPVEEALRERVPAFVPLEYEKLRVVLPVVRGDGDPAVLVLDGSRFQTVHVSLLALFARQLSTALESTRLLEEKERRNREQALLLELARATARTLDLSEILAAACEGLVKLLEASNSFVLLHDRDAGELRGAAASSRHRDSVTDIRIRLEDPHSVAALAARTRRTVEVENLAEAKLGRRDLVARFGEKALLAVPLLVRDELVGVVMVDDSLRARRFGPSVTARAEALAAQLALSIQNGRLYESLKHSYAQLENMGTEMVKRERLAALGELSAVVAHEVRNPLGVMFNAVVALRRMLADFPRAEDASSLLDIAREECERLDGLVGALLDYSSPKALALAAEEVAPLVEQTVTRALSALPDASPWDVRCGVAAALPPVPLDARMFRQALENLLMNALQSMPDGGKVEVAVGAEDGWLRVDVRDHGPGLAPELRERIFEPFFTTKAKGTGLGLALVRRVVEDHGGQVTASRVEEGPGSVFTMRLPCAARPGGQR